MDLRRKASFFWNNYFVQKDTNDAENEHRIWNLSKEDLEALNMLEKVEKWKISLLFWEHYLKRNSMKNF